MTTFCTSPAGIYPASTSSQVKHARLLAALGGGSSTGLARCKIQEHKATVTAVKSLGRYVCGSAAAQGQLNLSFSPLAAELHVACM